MTRVIYIDDEPLLCRVMASLLAGAGVGIVTFVDPHAALAYLGEHTVDVVICDYRMPVLSGLEVLARLPRPVPFYLVSGELEVTPPAGVLGVINKPFPLKELLDIIRRHVPTSG